MDDNHRLILEQIQRRAGEPTHDPFLERYLGNSHPRYLVNNKEMRGIAREFLRAHKAMDTDEFSRLLGSLVHGPSCTEKMMAGFLLDYSQPQQRKFKPALFEGWLQQLVGWVEIDTLCTGKYSRTEIPAQWQTWDSLLKKFSKSPNINLRRASLVLLCAPMRYTQDAAMAHRALDNIHRLTGEREVLITKAISWLLRSMIALYRKDVKEFVDTYADTLPSIAVREARTKLATGTKSKKKTA